MRLKARQRPFVLALTALCAAVLLVDLAFPPPLHRLDDVSVEVRDRDGQPLSAFTVDDGRWRLQTNLDRLDPVFIEQLIRMEDERFWTHSGTDGAAIIRALLSWQREGEIVSGASTITMQLARQLEPRPRNFGSKVVEMFRAWQIERRLSKAEILEAYLTRVPYGGNVEGLRAASLIYFGKEPGALTTSEAAILISLPQAPEARRPDLKPDNAKSSRDWVLTRLAGYGLLTDLQAREAKDEPVTARRSSLRELAWLEADAARKSLAETSINLTLDAALQQQLEDLLEFKGEVLSTETNIAAIVVDNRNMEVIARVGSIGRDRDGGWIDMSRRLRSPGSTLKPLVYGLAFDEGLSRPDAILDDAPTLFGSYQPENFGRNYYGMVRVREALAHSLNIPAVRILDDVGTQRFTTALDAAGVSYVTPASPDHETGLAVALGGGGMTLADLAVLYAGLANGGLAQPLKVYQNGEPAGPGYRFLSEDSAWEITEILREAPAPEGRMPSWLAENTPNIAYKTGTSYGFRDAWAAGYTDDWTVVVWVGRPDGAPRPGETGRDAAAPLLFDIISRLEHRARSKRGLEAPPETPGLAGQSRLTAKAPPHILFPENGTSIWLTDLGPDSRGVVLTGRASGYAPLRWYVNGNRIEPDETSGKPVWRPDAVGFYTLAAVDEDGLTSEVTVRVQLP